MARVLIVGAGAAGLMAAGAAVRQGHQVTVLEHTEKPGQKILVTGKGRCNVTNDCPAEEFLRHVRMNPRFLYSSLGAFPPAKTMELFEGLGVELKVERGRRVFPVSDKAEEIRQALLRYAQDADIVYDGAKKLLLEDIVPEAEPAPMAAENPRHPKKKKVGPALRCVGVRGTSGREYRADAVLVATGGVSYPTTGSTGDGYRMAAALGHGIVPPCGSLVPLVSDDGDCRRMQGLALKNVELTALNGKNKVQFRDFGELLFTHFGVSGPLVLSASAHLRHWDREKYRLCIDLKPALDRDKLEARILRDLGENPNRDFEKIVAGLVPHSMVPVLLDRLEVPAGLKANSVTKAQRRALEELLKGFTVSVTGPRPVAEAIVTSGGVQVSQVQPSTMESKLAPGLYFAGEILDVDAYTGGFNLQIAWSTGHLAGTSAAGAEGE